MKGIHQLTDVNSDAQNKGLSANLVIDRPTASRLGITPQAIDNVLYDAFGEREIATTYTPLNQYYVVMVVDPSFWQDPAALRQRLCLFQRRRHGAALGIHALRGGDGAAGRQSLERLSVRHVFIQSCARRGARRCGQSDQRRRERSAGMPSTITGSFSGTAQAFSDSLSSEPLLIAAAIAAVYVVLGVLYESYIHPITILSTLPSAGVGALLALLITHTDLRSSP